MPENLIAKATISINASQTAVWDAFVNPEIIKQYMFGTKVISDWTEGGSIVWKGQWQDKSYEDKGTILKFEPESLLEYSHFSPLSGKPDRPENYHTVTIELSGNDSQTEVILSQDNNPTEESQKHSAENWQVMLDGLKKLLENS